VEQLDAVKNRDELIVGLTSLYSTLYGVEPELLEQSIQERINFLTLVDQARHKNLVSQNEFKNFWGKIQYHLFLHYEYLHQALGYPSSLGDIS